MKKSIQPLLLAFVVLTVLLSGCAPKPWVAVESIVMREESPIEQQNVSDQWQGALLAENLKFSGDFEMKLYIQSMGKTHIGLTHTEGAGEPWWKDTKRMELICSDGKLVVWLRDGTSEDPVYAEELSMPVNGFETSCEITVKFDQSATKIQFLQNDKPILVLTPEEIGDFQGGLFPDGNILKVDTGLPPINAGNESVEIPSFKLIELIFSIPPSK